MSPVARLVVGAAVALAVLAVVALALRSAQGTAWRAQLTADCRVVVGEATVPLDREQARAATTAAATSLNGPAEAPPAGLGDAQLPDGVVDAVLSARKETALTCRWDRPDAPAQDLALTGLTPRAQAVHDAVEATFGGIPDGGFAPGGIDSGHGAESTHYEGRAIDYFFRPVSEENLDRGWVLAQWLVAHADELTVQYVIFDDSYWGVGESRRGWQDYRTPAGANEVLRHLDHVHVDVVRGD